MTEKVKFTCVLNLQPNEYDLVKRRVRAPGEETVELEGHIS